jgi:hypothetical protein
MRRFVSLTLQSHAAVCGQLFAPLDCDPSFLSSGLLSWPHDDGRRILAVGKQLVPVWTAMRGKLHRALPFLKPRASRENVGRKVYGVTSSGLCGSRLVACALVLAEALPLRGGPNLTPARRAFERPIAIACLAERAPCLRSRT